MSSSTRIQPTNFSSPPEFPVGAPFPFAYGFFTNVWTPIIFGALYFILAKTCSHYSDGKNRLIGKGWDYVIILHNLILAVYSGWTFVSTAPTFFSAFYNAFRTGGVAGLTHVFCDSDLAAWTTTTFPYFAYTFYLSKYWEVLDTVLILLKGKKVGMLQSYHHYGAMVSMHAGYTTMSMPIWIFVVFNSAIHTLMYCYYAFTAMKLPFPNFLKKSLTKLQITQFLIGGSLAASYLFIQIPSSFPSYFQLPTAPEKISAAFGNASHSFGTISLDSISRMGTQCVVGKAKRLAVWVNVIYLLPLTYLFIRFFIKSYKSKGAAGAKKLERSSNVSKGIKAE